MIVQTMTMGEALEVIQKEAESMGLGILETLQWMATNREELGSVEKCAYRIAMDGFQRLFQPKE